MRILTPEQKERRALYLRAWQERNRQKTRDLARAYAQKVAADPVLKAARNARALAWRKTHPKTPKVLTEEQKEARRAYMRQWYAAHPRTEEQKAAIKARRAIHRQDPNWVANERQRYRDSQARRRQNPQGDLISRVRSRTRNAIVRRRAYKTNTTSAFLGCTPAELKAHLESLFLPGMTWENRARWHIDHIRPCASFDLTDPEQQRCCFHFTNLQPLWARDNLTKGARVENV